MKRWVFTVFILVMTATVSLFAQQTGGAASILNHAAATNFATGAVPKADLDQIIQAGIRSPSASNRQPWHFTVVQEPALAKKVVPQALDGNVIIVVSAAGDGKTNAREIIDCALATQCIYLAAQALGYGSRIYTGPIDGLNRSLKTDLGLPSGYSAVALVRIGKKLDATSAASARKAADTMVTYK